MPKYQHRTAIPRDEHGNLEAFAWPGGYPIYYCDKENSILCQSCANAPTDIPQFAIDGWGYLEADDEELTCDNCICIINET
jgi:hypothetical protein